MSFLDRDGCFSFRSSLASIWRIRSEAGRFNFEGQTYACLALMPGQISNGARPARGK